VLIERAEQKDGNYSITSRVNMGSKKIEAMSNWSELEPRAGFAGVEYPLWSKGVSSPDERICFPTDHWFSLQGLKFWPVWMHTCSHFGAGTQLW